MSYLAALVTGLLLFASDHPLQLWWLQFVALVPFWWALQSQRIRGRRLWPIGLIAAAANAVPLVVATGPAPPIVAAAAVVLLQWPLVAMLAGRALTRGAVAGPLAAAAIVTASEVLIWYAVPIFGTAQCFVRPLSAAPAAVAFIAFTGVGGLVFTVAATQALAAAALRGAERRRPLLACAALVLAVAALDVARWQRPSGGTLTVAAAGWRHLPAPSDDLQPFVDELFARAEDAGARLLVTPEVSWPVGIEGHFLGPRAEAIARLSQAVRANGLGAVIGVFQNETDDNRAWLLTPDGELAGEYRKSHLIPWLEDYVCGDGTLVMADVDGVRCGAMICQDDNFTDLGRGYGRAGAQLVAVPTNDWPAIREYHLENGVFRAIENGYAVVRAASMGVSALITPRGEVVARFDHVAGGEHLLTAELPVGDGVPTLYARLGDLPVVGLCMLLLLFVARVRDAGPTATA